MLKILPVFFLLAASTHYYGEYLFFQWYAYACVLPLFILWASRSLPKTFYGRLLTTSFTFYYLNICYMLLFRDNRFLGNSELVRASFAVFAAHQLIFALLIFVPLLQCSLEKLRNLKLCLGLYCLANSLYTIIGAMYGFGKPIWAPGFSGFIDNPSHNACLIACTLPFINSVFKQRGDRVVIYSIPIAAIFLAKSSVPIGALAVVVAGLYLTSNYKLRQKLIACGLGVTLILGLALILDKNLFDSAYRFQAYKIFMYRWYLEANFLVGFGPGSFQVLGPNIQLPNPLLPQGFMMDLAHNQGHFWTYMHSEWLQLLFENGFIGLFLVTAIFIKALLVFLRADWDCLIASMALGTSVLFNYHTRFTLGAFLLGFLIVYSYRLDQYEHA